MKRINQVLGDIARRKDVFLALVRRALPQVTVALEHPPLSCLKCPSFCCKLAGYVEVRGRDISRLAKHFGMTNAEFEAKHIVEKTKKGEKLIKAADRTCQFLSPEGRCSVYEARPTDCRGYVCWDQHDSTVYNFAYFAQTKIPAQRRAEVKLDAEEKAEKEREAARRRRKRARA